MDIEALLPLAPRDLLILSVLADGPLHGYGIIKAAQERSESGVSLDPANLYRVLRRMRRAGWIREETGDGTTREGKASPNGNAREYRRRTYRITGVGGSLLAAELARLERLLAFTRPSLATGRRS